jgi:RNA polymerase sigma-70 factor (ECF subfamily)
MTAARRYQAEPTFNGASTRRRRLDDGLAARFVLEVLPLREALRRQAIGLLHNPFDAEDLVQETIINAYLAFQSFQTGTNMRAWLGRIMLNSYLSHYRKARRRPLVSSTEDLTDQLLAQVGARQPWAALRSAEEQWLDLFQDPVIEDAMRALPEPFRLVVYYRDVEGLPHKEIAALMNIPSGTVVSRLSRGRKRLRALLAESSLAVGGCGFGD